MDKIAEKESFFNLLNSVIAFAVYYKSNLLDDLRKIQHSAYYNQNFSFSDGQELLFKIKQELLCKNT